LFSLLQCFYFKHCCCWWWLFPHHRLFLIKAQRQIVRFLIASVLFLFHLPFLSLLSSLSLFSLSLTHGHSLFLLFSPLPPSPFSQADLVRSVVNKLIVKSELESNAGGDNLLAEAREMFQEADQLRYVDIVSTEIVFILVSCLATMR
jgi:hypothetical protein